MTIPKALVELLGLREQDELEFALVDGKIILKKRKKGAKDID